MSPGEAADDIRDWKEYGPEEAWAVLKANHARLDPTGPPIDQIAHPHHIPEAP